MSFADVLRASAARNVIEIHSERIKIDDVRCRNENGGKSAVVFFEVWKKDPRHT